MKLIFDTRGNEKQKDCVRAWCDPDATDIVYGGAKGGAKSFTGCKLIFGDALIYPDTFYFIARKKLNDLRKYTIPSIYECFQDWGLDITKYAKFNGQDNYFELNNKSRVYLLEVAYMPSDPNYYRFGSLQFTRGWGEETGEWEEAAKNNLQAAIGRWNNSKYGLVPKLLQTCNPSKNYLYREYYRKFKEGKLEPWKRFIQALPNDNKMLSPDYILNLQRTLSKNEKERLLYGNWEYDDDPATLIDYDKIIDIFSNTHIPEGEKRITCDVARYGGDRIVIIEWSGWRGKVKSYQKQGLDETAQLIEQSRIKLGCGKSDIIVDEDGVGGGIVDFYKCKGFVNNSSPLPSPEGEYDIKGNPIKENFDNLKSQCYYRLAQRINKNGIYLECESEEDKQLIIEELEQVKQKAVDSDMKKGIMPKDKVKEILGRSPDFADAIMIREHFDLKPIRQFADAYY